MIIKLLKIKALIYYSKLFLARTKEFFSKSQIKANVILLQLCKNKILLGPYFSSLGGVSHHMQSIRKFSNLNVSLLPSQSAQNFIYRHNLLNYYKVQVENLTFKKNIIHSHVDPWFIHLSQKAQLNSSKWIHTYHTLYFENDWKNGLENWQRDINKSLIEVAKYADVRISISHWLKNYLELNYNIKTTYIPNGVDVAKCDLADKNGFINKYSLKDFILFASGISDIKNPGDFLKLANAMPHKQFVIIGRGISKQALVKKYKMPLGDNLTVLGKMQHLDLLDAIAACKVFVVTSKSEGLPTVLMEAMTLERSVVGVDTYGTKEVIHSEEYGYIYKQDDLEDLISKTKQALEQSKGLKARQRVIENYDWKVIAPQIDKVYKSLL